MFKLKLIVAESNESDTKQKERLNKKIKLSKSNVREKLIRMCHVLEHSLSPPTYSYKPGLSNPQTLRARLSQLTLCHLDDHYSLKNIFFTSSSQLAHL